MLTKLVFVFAILSATSGIALADGEGDGDLNPQPLPPIAEGEFG